MLYLTTTEVLEIHRAETGDDRVDLDLLDSAVHRPQATAGGQDAYPSVHTKAAVLAHSLIVNHPFVDGNKRTAMLSVVVFYGLNGYTVILNDDEILALAIGLAQGLLDVVAVAKRLARGVLDPHE